MSLAQLAARERLAFPLDYPDLTQARAGAELVSASAGILKVGLELFVREGPEAVSVGRGLNARIFLDLKLHDIPATVERAVASAGELGVAYLTVHATGGPKMLEAASRRAETAGVTLLAVTVLTSLDASDLQSVGVSAAPEAQVQRLARLAWTSGIKGFVCSPAEVKSLRSAFGPEAVFVTPGIRPAGATAGDQKRTGTPEQAIRDGATILVVGRPIRDASDPAGAARAIAADIASALS